jgi:2-succinyl-6-hydroxy-2,4-cyclohexadiene-1-carboxylate synthase
MTGYLLNHRLTTGKNAPVILYLHGFMGDVDDWDEIVERLGERFSHLTVDLPGHGASTVDLPDDAYSMPGTSHLVIDLLDHLSIDSCRLVGYSMGGRLGLYLLTHYPERFSRAVIESASPGLKTAHDRAARRKQDTDAAQQIQKSGLSKFLTSWYEQPLFASLDRSGDRFKAMLDRREKQNPAGLARSLEQMGTGAQPSLWKTLESLEVPTMFVAGEKDIKFAVLADQMAALCQSGRSAIIPDAGHMVHFEQPDRFCKTALNFLSE